METDLSIQPQREVLLEPPLPPGDDRVSGVCNGGAENNLSDSPVLREKRGRGDSADGTRCETTTGDCESEVGYGVEEQISSVVRARIKSFGDAKKAFCESHCVAKDEEMSNMIGTFRSSRNYTMNGEVGLKTNGVVIENQEHCGLDDIVSSDVSSCIARGTCNEDLKNEVGSPFTCSGVWKDSCRNDIVDVRSGGKSTTNACQDILSCMSGLVSLDEPSGSQDPSRSNSGSPEITRLDSVGSKLGSANVCPKSGPAPDPMSDPDLDECSRKASESNGDLMCETIDRELKTNVRGSGGKGDVVAERILSDTGSSTNDYSLDKMDTAASSADVQNTSVGVLIAGIDDDGPIIGVAVDDYTHFDAILSKNASAVNFDDTVLGVDLDEGPKAFDVFVVVIPLPSDDNVCSGPHLTDDGLHAEIGNAFSMDGVRDGIVDGVCSGARFDDDHDTLAGPCDDSVLADDLSSMKCGYRASLIIYGDPSFDLVTSCVPRKSALEDSPSCVTGIVGENNSQVFTPSSSSTGQYPAKDFDGDDQSCYESHDCARGDAFDVESTLDSGFVYNLSSIHNNISLSAEVVPVGCNAVTNIIADSSKSYSIFQDGVVNFECEDSVDAPEYIGGDYRNQSVDINAAAVEDVVGGSVIVRNSVMNAGMNASVTCSELALDTMVARPVVTTDSTVTSLAGIADNTVTGPVRDADTTVTSPIVVADYTATSPVVVGDTTIANSPIKTDVNSPVAQKPTKSGSDTISVKSSDAVQCIAPQPKKKDRKKRLQTQVCSVAPLFGNKSLEATIHTGAGVSTATALNTHVRVIDAVLKKDFAVSPVGPLGISGSKHVLNTGPKEGPVSSSDDRRTSSEGARSDSVCEGSSPPSSDGQPCRNHLDDLTTIKNVFTNQYHGTISQSITVLSSNTTSRVPDGIAVNKQSFNDFSSKRIDSSTTATSVCDSRTHVKPVNIIYSAGITSTLNGTPILELPPSIDNLKSCANQNAFPLTVGKNGITFSSSETESELFTRPIATSCDSKLACQGNRKRPSHALLSSTQKSLSESDIGALRNGLPAPGTRRRTYPDRGGSGTCGLKRGLRVKDDRRFCLIWEEPAASSSDMSNGDQISKKDNSPRFSDSCAISSEETVNSVGTGKTSVSPSKNLTITINGEAAFDGTGALDKVNRSTVDSSDHLKIDLGDTNSCERCGQVANQVQLEDRTAVGFKVSGSSALQATDARRFLDLTRKSSTGTCQLKRKEAMKRASRPATTSQRSHSRTPTLEGDCSSGFDDPEPLDSEILLTPQARDKNEDGHPAPCGTDPPTCQKTSLDDQTSCDSQLEKNLNQQETRHENSQDAKKVDRTLCLNNSLHATSSKCQRACKYRRCPKAFGRLVQHQPCRLNSPSYQCCYSKRADGSTVSEIKECHVERCNTSLCKTVSRLPLEGHSGNDENRSLSRRRRRFCTRHSHDYSDGRLKGMVGNNDEESLVSCFGLTRERSSIMCKPNSSLHREGTDGDCGRRGRLSKTGFSRGILQRLSPVSRHRAKSRDGRASSLLDDDNVEEHSDGEMEEPGDSSLTSSRRRVKEMISRKPIASGICGISGICCVAGIEDKPLLGESTNPGEVSVVQNGKTLVVVGQERSVVQGHLVDEIQPVHQNELDRIGNDENGTDAVATKGTTNVVNSCQSRASKNCCSCSKRCKGKHKVSDEENGIVCDGNVYNNNNNSDGCNNKSSFRAFIRTAVGDVKNDHCIITSNNNNNKDSVNGCFNINKRNSKCKNNYYANNNYNNMNKRIHEHSDGYHNRKNRVRSACLDHCDGGRNAVIENPPRTRNRNDHSSSDRITSNNYLKRRSHLHGYSNDMNILVLKKKGSLSSTLPPLSATKGIKNSKSPQRGSRVVRGDRFTAVSATCSQAVSGALSYDALQTPESSRAKRHRATKEFLERANSVRAASGGAGASQPLQWNQAVKFLMARKFDVHRALQLFQQHEATRQKEGLTELAVQEEPLRSELATGKFTILRCRDVSGAALALFSARLHDPRQSTHQTTLQALVCQLDAALQSSDTQRHGLIFIYDMTDSLYQNFDYQLSQKILTLLKGAYPARLKKVLIVTAPLWFKAPFKVLRLFVREKLRDRVYTVTLSELAQHIARECLPPNLGGTLVVDHQAWLATAIPAITTHAESNNGLGSHSLLSLKDMEPPLDSLSEQLEEQQQQGSPRHSDRRVTTTAHDLVNGGDITSPEFSEDDDSSDDESCSERDLHDAEDDLQTLDHRGSTAPDTTPSSSGGSNGGEGNDKGAESDRRKSGGDQGEADPREEGDDEEEGKEVAVVNGHNGLDQSNGDCGSLSANELATLEPSLHDESCEGFSLDQFVEHLKHKARLGLHTDYMQIKNTPPPGNFENSRRRCNQLKNRYTDVLCLDHSRVVLNDPSEEKHNDYINANFVDGYKQKNAFISTQGPLPHTSPDFWRMIWEQRVVVVVMTTRVVERGRTKCGQYWPEREGSTMRFPQHAVTNKHVEEGSDFITTTLDITDVKSGESRLVSHFQFSSWPDYGVPDSAVAMLEFLERVREAQATNTANLSTVWRGHELGPPIVVHCSAGIGRTGTFCTLDICIRRLEDVGVIDVRGTVQKIRSQRAYSIQMPDQYVFCHLALLEYALLTGKMPDADLTGFEGDASDSD